jgi:hypothetical protein
MDRDPAPLGARFAIGAIACWAAMLIFSSFVELEYTPEIKTVAAVAVAWPLIGIAALRLLGGGDQARAMIRIVVAHSCAWFAVCFVLAIYPYFKLKHCFMSCEDYSIIYGFLMLDPLRSLALFSAPTMGMLSYLLWRELPRSLARTALISIPSSFPFAIAIGVAEQKDSPTFHVGAFFSDLPFEWMLTLVVTLIGFTIGYFARGLRRRPA